MVGKQSGHWMSQGGGVGSNREGGVGGLSGVVVMFCTLMGLRVVQVGTKCHCYDLCMSLYIKLPQKNKKR